MSAAEMVVMIAAGALATQLTRWLPFLAFPTPEKTPKTVTYLGKVLPACMWGLLIVYCFRTGDPFSGWHMAVSYTHLDVYKRQGRARPCQGRG